MTSTLLTLLICRCQVSSIMEGDDSADMRLRGTHTAHPRHLYSELNVLKLLLPLPLLSQS
jgi:hypothetical protein